MQNYVNSIPFFLPYTDRCKCSKHDFFFFLGSGGQFWTVMQRVFLFLIWCLPIWLKTFFFGLRLAKNKLQKLLIRLCINTNDISIYSNIRFTKSYFLIFYLSIQINFMLILSSLSFLTIPIKENWKDDIV